MQTWTSETIQIDAAMQVDVKANEKGVVLGQHNDVWFHDLHVNPQKACAIGFAMIQGAMACLQAQLEAKA
jgi:hypothetical protein